MEAALITSESKAELKHLLALAKSLGMDIKILTPNALEDMALAEAMDKGRTGKYVDNNAFLKNLKERIK